MSSELHLATRQLSEHCSLQAAGAAKCVDARAKARHPWPARALPALRTAASDSKMLCVATQIEMQGGEQFSLGGALFGWPHAGECASPDEHAPEAWLLLFRNKHATSDILYAAMTACKAGRELWTEQLQTAPSATLTLDFSSDPPAEDGWERLGAARRALKTRGKHTDHSLTTARHAQCLAVAQKLTLPRSKHTRAPLLRAGACVPLSVACLSVHRVYLLACYRVLAGPLPTALVVKCNEDGCPQHGLFSALPHALAGCGQHITSVTLTATQKAGYPDLATASALVRGIAAVCPNMTFLAFDFPCLLPPPALLPSLTHLKIDLPLEPDGHHGTYEVRSYVVCICGLHCAFAVCLLYHVAHECRAFAPLLVLV